MISSPGTPRIQRRSGTIIDLLSGIESAGTEVSIAVARTPQGVTDRYRCREGVVGGTGLEPVASCMSSMCSNQLS